MREVQGTPALPGTVRSLMLRGMLRPPAHTHPLLWVTNLGAEPSGGHQAQPLFPAAPTGTPRARGVAQGSAAPCATVPWKSPGARHGLGTASSTQGSPPCPPGLPLPDRRSPAPTRVFPIP